MENGALVVGAGVVAAACAYLAGTAAWKGVRPRAWHHFLLCFLLGAFLFFPLLVAAFLLVADLCVAYVLYQFLSPVIDAVLFQ